jgi:hypothetical protein
MHTHTPRHYFTPSSVGKLAECPTPHTLALTFIVLLLLLLLIQAW